MGSRLIVLALLGLLSLALFPDLSAREMNFWPAFVKQWDAPLGRADQTSALGPIFALKDKEETRILSIRPLWTYFDNKNRESSHWHLVYPFANWYHSESSDFAHVLNLLQFRRDRPQDETFFQFFPFLFINHAPEPDDSYYALWPVGGVLKNRLFRDRITFAAWPLFVRTHRKDEVYTHFPYPFLRILDGPHSSGWGVWPLYGQFQRENDYAHRWALWPLLYHYRDNLDEEVPYVRMGFLPFYHRETAAGLKSETVIWPFFGYTRENDPRPEYSENRYFWPLLVQGRGEEKYVNRWMPLYTHERRPGYAKQWYLWPFLERETFEEPGLVRERDSFLYFIWRDERQYFADTRARLTFLWPLFGYWHDGYEHTQFQAPDPLSVFFPRNDKVRENWTPLFALYRYDERQDNRRHSLLWDFVVWERDQDGPRAFYLGPLFEWVRGSHWEVLKGLVGSEQVEEESHFKYLWRD